MGQPRRKRLADYAVWEIHRVMALRIVEQIAATESGSLSMRMKKLTAVVELERAVCIGLLIEQI